MPIPVPVELDWPQSGSGLLAQSRPLPEGWQRGIKFRDTSCVLPVAMGECPTGENLKPTSRADSIAEFHPFEAILALQCSTLDNRTDWDAVTGAELDRTRDYAIASELLTGAARERDKSGDYDVLALVNTAEPLPATPTTVTEALGCIETAVMSANGDRGAVMFVPINVAAQALAEGSIWRDGGRWRTVLGSAVIVSAAFDGRAPAEIDSQAPPAPGEDLYVYATTAVWAGVGTRSTLHDVERDVNDVNARAEDQALVAFAPCATYAVATPVTTCDLEGS